MSDIGENKNDLLMDNIRTKTIMKDLMHPLCAEHRLLAKVSSGPHSSYADEWLERWSNDYVLLPAEKRNIVDGTTHAIAGAISVVTEGLDLPFEYLARKIDGKSRPVTPLDGFFARTRRSVKDLVTEPGIASTIATVFRAPGDIGMDIIDGAIGNTHR